MPASPPAPAPADARPPHRPEHTVSSERRRLNKWRLNWTHQQVVRLDSSPLGLRLSAVFGLDGHMRALLRHEGSERELTWASFVGTRIVSDLGQHDVPPRYSLDTSRWFSMAHAGGLCPEPTADASLTQTGFVSDDDTDDALCETCTRCGEEVDDV